MTAYALHHDPDCPCPSTYYEIRPGCRLPDTPPDDPEREETLW